MERVISEDDLVDGRLWLFQGSVSSTFEGGWRESDGFAGKKKGRKRHVLRKANLLDVHSLKSMFPGAAGEPLVLNRKEPVMQEVISEEVVIHLPQTRRRQTDQQHNPDAEEGHRTKRIRRAVTKRGDGKISARELTKGKRHFRDDKPTKVNNNALDEIEKLALEEEMRMAQSLGLSLEQMRRLDEAEKQLQDDSAMYLRAFKEFDEDGSGDISPDELRKVLENIGQDLPKEEIDTIIAEADTDGDGTINYEEFVNLMKARKRILAMAGTLHKVKDEENAFMERSRKRGVQNSDEEVFVALGIQGTLALPPLKLPKASLSRQLARRRPRPMPYSHARKTPHVLHPGHKVNADELRRALNQTESLMKKLNDKVQENVQWVQENCNVTSLRAQLYCKRWGMQKLQNVMKRLEYKEVIAAWGIWNRFVLNHRNQAQVEKYMKLKGSRRLTSLFANWKRKQMVASWNTWLRIIDQQRKLEREAAVRQIQRAGRGFLGRIHARSRKRYYAAVDIERVIRGFLGRMRASKARIFKREWDAAVFIQRAYRGYEGKKLAKLIAQTHLEQQSAVRIQKIWRGKTARQRVAVLRLENLYRESAMNIQRVWRGHIARQETGARQQAIAEHIASIRIQACLRGYLGRMEGLEIIETRMQLIAEEEAALKIQTCFRGMVAHVIVHGMRRERAAIKLQTRWRAHHKHSCYKVMLAEQRERHRRRNESSVMIQCMLRQRLARKRLAEKREELGAALKIQRLRRGQIGRRKFHSERVAHERHVREKLRTQRENEAALRIQTRYRAHNARLAYQLKKQALAQQQTEHRNRAATKIQALHRGHLERKLVQRLREARQLERQKQQWREQEEALRKKEEENRAATRIQALFRGKRDRIKLAKQRLEEQDKRDDDDDNDDEQIDSEAKQVEADHLKKPTKKKKKKKVATKKNAKKKQRRRPIDSGKSEDEQAALVIQKHVRGKLARNSLIRTNREKASLALEELRREEERKAAQEREAASIKIQNQVRIRHANKRVAEKKKELENLRRQDAEHREREIQEASALVIQNHVRAALARKSLALRKREHEEQLQNARNESERQVLQGEQRWEIASIKIQTMFRSYRDRMRVDKLRKQQEERKKQAELARKENAAIRIQTQFRIRRDKMRVQQERENLRREREHKETAFRERAEAERRRIEEERLAALKMQAMVRGRNARKALERKRAQALTQKLRQKQLEEQRREENAKEQAALKIQCAFRTRKAKREIKARREKHEAELQRLREQGAREEEIKRAEEEQERELAATKVQSVYRAKVVRMQVQAKKAALRREQQNIEAEIERTTREAAASRIQALYRGKRDRKFFQAKMEQIERARKEREQNALYGGLENEKTSPVGEWVQYWDQASQAYYYFNIVTQEARWELEPGMQLATATDGYQTAGSVTDYDTDNYDPNAGFTGGYYDYDGNWVQGGTYDFAADPYAQQYVYQQNGYGAYDHPQYGNSGFNTNAMFRDQQQQQQQGWEEYFDDSYQCSYYFNIYTGETVWEPPPGFVSVYDDPYTQAPRYNG